jgi:L-ascorbate metabolism protein UlaG (beta-lactamase superfamily)
MKITKISHCCLVIEEGGKTVLTDPGTFSTEQNDVRGIDAVIITHEHGDHFHIESVKQIIANNPEVKIIANSSVGKLLDQENIPHEVVDGTTATEVAGIKIEALDGKHEEIFEELGQVQNTGYFIADKLFYPGDSFKEPGRSIEILALPVAGPWCKMADALRYAIKVKPTKAFPVHDAVLRNPEMMHPYVGKVLEGNGIEFAPLRDGDMKEL